MATVVRRMSQYTRSGRAYSRPRYVAGGRHQERARGPNVDSRARAKASSRPFRPRIG